MSFIKLLRPHQWVKNAFVFLPLFFYGHFTDISLLVQSLFAFLAFSFVASSIYCFNDIYDVEADRNHPEKKKRPVASGKVTIPMAYTLMGICLLISFLIAYYGIQNNKWLVLGVLAFYFLMNIAYCIKLKQVAIVDIFIISVGFVLRVVVGGLSTGAPLSHWIVLMTFLLALFLAFAKRRDDVVKYENTGIIHRRNVNRYNLNFMNQAMTLVSGITLVAYVMYTVSPEVMERLGSNYIYITSVFVLAGIIKYLQISIVDVKSGSPTKVLLKNRFIQCCVLGWIITFAVLIYM